ncbi:MAG: ATP-grasp domain-containing protein [Solobacterium sp.]|nr:ATP-grasp domain-containing protein [Solobacterium sp.]
MNILFCSVGRRGELLKDFRKSVSDGSVFVATDNSKYAPALYFADKQYIVPRIDAPEYIDILLDICRKESIQAVATFIDPEIELLAKNRFRFEELGITLLVPSEETARLSYDKYQMYQYLTKHNISTTKTWGTIEEFKNESGVFPVFVKPRTGSGSVGARRINSMVDLEVAVQNDPTLIIQEFMDCTDLDADVYIDTISHEAVSAFTKYKIETRIGGASKTVSFKDDRLFDFIREICSLFEFNGAVDMDFFRRGNQYYLSEVNPRFGGAYLHAYGAGVDFIKLIENNIKGIENKPCFGDYDEGVVMMMYDSVVIKTADELAAEE